MDEILKAGRRLACRERCPLMYEWHGKKYWGAAHGLARIMHVLMDIELKLDEIEDIKGTLRYMIKIQFSSGNNPSSKGNESDRLVHWCHGAPRVAQKLYYEEEAFGFVSDLFSQKTIVSFSFHTQSMRWRLKSSTFWMDVIYFFH